MVKKLSETDAVAIGGGSGLEVEKWVNVRDIVGMTIQIEAVYFGAGQYGQKVIFVGSVEGMDEVIGVSHTSLVLIEQGQKLKKDLPVLATFAQETSQSSGRVYYFLTDPGVGKLRK